MKRLAAMAAVAAAAVAAVLGLRAYEARQQAADEASRALLAVDTQALQRIVFTRRDEEPKRVAFERRDGEWWLTEPLLYPASRTGLKSLLEQLGELRYDRSLGNVEPAKFGLDAPRYRAEFYTQAASDTILIGNDTPFGGELYVQRGDSSEVMIAAKGFEYQFAKEPKQWRAPELFLYDYPATVVTLEFATETSQWTLTRHGDTWLADDGRTLDYGLVKALVTRIGNLAVRGYLSDNAAADLGNYEKLDPPLRRLTVTGADGRTLALHFGQGPLADGTVPVHVTWRNQLVSIAAYAYEGLWKSPAELMPPPPVTTTATAAATETTAAFTPVP